MKNVLFITALFISLYSVAQDDPKARFGLKGGVNFSNLHNTGDNFTDNNAKLGFHFGVFAKVPLVSTLYLQPELLYTTKGSSSSYKIGEGILSPGVGKIDFNLNYLQLPVLLVFNFNKYINVQAGAYGAYLLNTNIQNKSENTNYNTFEQLNPDNFQRFDAGLSGGVGVDVYPVIFGIRYDYSLIDLGKSGLSGAITQNSRNSCLQVYVGVGI